MSTMGLTSFPRRWESMDPRLHGDDNCYNIAMKLNAKELRDVKEEDIVDKLKTIKRRPMYFILENIYDTYNIGGLFRLADALAIEKCIFAGSRKFHQIRKLKRHQLGHIKSFLGNTGKRRRRRLLR